MLGLEVEGVGKDLGPEGGGVILGLKGGGVF